MITDKNLAKIIIAKRTAQEFKDGQLVNLGIGLPSLVSNYIPENMNITFQSENGMVGVGPSPTGDDVDVEITNAGGVPVTILPGGSFFDSSLSFALIRGGHVDITVLGTLEVDQEGNLASWIIPGKKVPGMGGAMDLVSGAKKVIVTTLHYDNGSSKVLKKCKLPLTAKGQVDLIITELAVMEVTKEGLLLKEIHKDTTIEEVKSLTDADLIIPDNVKIMDIA